MHSLSSLGEGNLSTGSSCFILTCVKLSSCFPRVSILAWLGDIQHSPVLITIVLGMDFDYRECTVVTPANLCYSVLVATWKQGIPKT